MRRDECGLHRPLPKIVQDRILTTPLGNRGQENSGKERGVERIKRGVGFILRLQQEVVDLMRWSDLGLQGLGFLVALRSVGARFQNRGHCWSRVGFAIRCNPTFCDASPCVVEIHFFSRAEIGSPFVWHPLRRGPRWPNYVFLSSRLTAVWHMTKLRRKKSIVFSFSPFLFH